MFLQEPVPCELAAPPAASSSSKVKYEQVYSDTDTDSSSDGDNVPLSTFVEKTNAPGEKTWTDGCLSKLLLLLQYLMDSIEIGYRN